MGEQCKAKSKTTEKRCKQPAVRFGVCFYHGGAPGAGADSGKQIKHGRYSKCLPSNLKDKYEYYKTDPDFLNLLNEISVARALFDDFVGKFEGVPLNAESIEFIGGHLERISRLVEKEHKRRFGETYTINVEGLNAVLAQVVDIITRHVKDEDTLKAIADELRNIKGMG